MVDKWKIMDKLCADISTGNTPNTSQFIRPICPKSANYLEYLGKQFSPHVHCPWYRLDGQVCLEFGVIVPLFIPKMVDNTKFQVCLKFSVDDKVKRGSATPNWRQTWPSKRYVSWVGKLAPNIVDQDQFFLRLGLLCACLHIRPKAYYS